MDEADSYHHSVTSRDDYDAPEQFAATSQGQVFAGHSYPAINISGQAQVQLGDRHYHLGSHDELQRLASSLHFPEIHRRYESVDDAHSDTFDWIFEPPGRQQPPWSSFVDWLKNEQPLYWVSGKPGSGKSTLMKHVVETIQQQHQEDSQHTPIVLSFWFWEAGSKLEHSLLGCMRSLLWQLLQDPRSSYVVVQIAQCCTRTPWTTKRLKDILTKVIQQLIPPILLFLDGLDEAGAEGEALLALVRQLVQAPHKLKICVSSRPEQAYMNAFCSHPHLRVQGLNYEDIRAIIAQDLLGNPSTTKLAQHNDHSPLKRLTSSIEERAHGVLLWVRLVVRSLLRGVQNLDDIGTLQHRLDGMPDDLEELYEQILHRNNRDHKHYAAETAFYFQFLLHRGEDVDIIQQCLAIDDDLRRWCMNPETGWNSSEIRARFDCERVRTWISVRTGGLLEVYERESHSEDESYLQAAGKQNDSSHSNTFESWCKKYSGWRARFIHRTALTFVSETSRGRGLLSASRRSPAELVRICFECRFTEQVIFSALAGQPRSPRYELRRYCFHEASRESLCEMPPQSIAEFERACNGLLAKGFLLLNEFNFLSNPDCSIGRVTYPTSDGSTIDYCRLYCMHGLWEHMHHGLVKQCNDVDYLSTLLASVVFGLSSLREVPRQEAGTALFVRLIELGADPCRQVTFYNGESAWLLPYIVQSVSEDTPMNIVRAILRFDLSHSMENLPLISFCNEFCWTQYSTPEVWLWGIYRIPNIAGFIESHDPKMRSPDLDSSRVYTCSEVCGYLGPEPHLLSRKPRLYATSSEQSRKILELHRQWLIKNGRDIPRMYKLNGACGMVVLPSHLMNKEDMRPLRSFFEAMVYMGKSEDSISQWAAVEERRMRHTRVDEAKIAHWKSWVFGSDNGTQQDEDSGTAQAESRSLTAVSDIPQSLPSAEHHNSDMDQVYAPDHGTAVSKQEVPTMRNDERDRWRSSKLVVQKKSINNKQ